MEEISTESVHYSWLEACWKNAFPESERGNETMQHFNVDCEDRFHCTLFFDKQKPIGFINWWVIEDFRYIEHFAIASQFRNCGYGSQVLSHFIRCSSHPIILEVELPNSDQAIKRINFYERIGFKGHPKFKYIQPPYPGSEIEVPLMLMTYGGIFSKARLKDLVIAMYTMVYRTEVDYFSK